MTHHYLACVAADGGPHLPPPLATLLDRLGWVRVWRAPGIEVRATPGLPLLAAADDRLIVLGALFANDSGSQEVRRCALDATPPERLVRRCWGAYVAFAAGEIAAQVLRDPSGGLGCYHARVEGMHVLTSAPHLLIESGLIAPSIDWEMIAQALARPSARSARTAIHGVNELLPGRSLALAGNGSTVEHCLWDPWTFAAGDPPDHPAEALAATLTRTLAAWAGTMRKPLVEISGGLDSAIVAAGIAAAAPSAAAITFAPAAGDPDERLYAQAIAEELGIPLEIAMPCVADVDLTVSHAARLPRPTARAFTQSGDLLSLRHARAIGADGFLSGGGGDDVFCYLRSVLPAIDRLHAQGWRAMMRTAHDIAVMNHSTLWQALARIARRLATGRSRRAPEDLRFLTPTRPRSPLARRFVGPDAGDAGAHVQESDVGAAAPSRTPGKADHVRGIATIHNHLEGHARADHAPILSPLLSQPIVELCLAIPSWRWCEGGVNRAVARRAMARRLPPIVLERRSKGAFDAFGAQLFEANRALVRALLMDGALRRRDIIDAAAVEAALRLPSPPADTIARLMALVDVEAWIASQARSQPPG